VRTVRRDPVDYAALAQAALEHAAMNQSGENDAASSPPSSPEPALDRRQHHSTSPKESRRDRLA
jgi:hypothetical protein